MAPAVAKPMSNHGGGVLVRRVIERLPPQSFALGVARRKSPYQASAPVRSSRSRAQ
jgi:hypothetical protein